MKKIVTCAALGLSITAGSLAIATPASAYVLWNLKAEQEGHSICMASAEAIQAAMSRPGPTSSCGTATTRVTRLGASVARPRDFEWVDAATDTAGHSMCLNDTGGNNDRGAQVTIAACTNYTSQKFLLIG